MSMVRWASARAVRLLADENFTTLLKTERLQKMPAELKELTRKCLLALFMAALLVILASVVDLTPDGILFGHWPENDDHPTNWYDAALHPDAQQARIKGRRSKGCTCHAPEICLRVVTAPIAKHHIRLIQDSCTI